MRILAAVILVALSVTACDAIKQHEQKNPAPILCEQTHCNPNGNSGPGDTTSN